MKKQVDAYFGTKSILKVLRRTEIKGLILVAQIIIRKEKYNILLDHNRSIFLFKSFTDEAYGELSLSEAKRLIKVNS